MFFNLEDEYGSFASDTYIVTDHRTPKKNPPNKAARLWCVTIESIEGDRFVTEISALGSSLAEARAYGPLREYIRGTRHVLASTSYWKVTSIEEVIR